MHKVQLEPSQEATGKSSLAIWADSYHHSLSHTVCVCALDAMLCVLFGYLYRPSTEMSLSSKKYRNESVVTDKVIEDRSGYQSFL